jgi:type I restriction enzyme M protein
MLQQALFRTRKGGLICLAMCNAFLHSSLVQEATARKALVDNGELLCVLSLPGRLFSGEKAPMSIVVLVKGGTLRDHVLFIDAQTKAIECESNLTGGRRFLSESAVKSIVKTLRFWLEHTAGYRDMPGFCRAVPFREIEEETTILVPWFYTSESFGRRSDSEDCSGDDLRTLMLEHDILCNKIETLIQETCGSCVAPRVNEP